MGLFDFFKKIIGKKEAHLPLLRQYLSAMPPMTQIEQNNRFEYLEANFEFGTWILLDDADILVKRYMNRGFTVWCNADSESAFLYGAKKVKEEDISRLVMEISQITLKGKEGQALLLRENSKKQFITIEGGLIE